MQNLLYRKTLIAVFKICAKFIQQSGKKLDNFCSVLVAVEVGSHIQRRQTLVEEIFVEVWKR